MKETFDINVLLKKIEEKEKASEFSRNFTEQDELNLLQDSFDNYDKETAVIR